MSVEANVAQAHGALRESFDSGKTRDIEARRQQLQQLLRMFENEQQLFQDALFKDLKKNAWEAKSTEIFIVMNEIKYMLDNLDTLAAPKKAHADPIEHLSLTLTGGATNYAYPDPYGVCLIMAPWNYPIHQMFMPLAGSIAAGNASLLKPASTKYAPTCSQVIYDMVKKYLDPAFVRVIQGSREANAALLQHRYDFIFFTGGSYVGGLVAASAAKHFTPVILEMGGQNSVIVDQHTNIETAAKRMVWGKFTNCGQICITGNHFFVHEKVADDFIKACIKHIRSFYGTKPSEVQNATHSYGRLVNKTHFKKIKHKLDADFQHVVYGGHTDEDDLFVEPTILDFGSDIAALMNSECLADEIFGPLLPVVRFTDVSNVIKEVNKLEKCLAMQIYTNDSTLRERILRETSCGNVTVNDALVHMVGPLPFGGVGHSGMGAYHHKATFDIFTHHKTVMMRNFMEVPELRYPPYTNSMNIRILTAALWPRSRRQNQAVKLVLFALGIVAAAYVPAPLVASAKSATKGALLYLARLL